MRSMLRQLVVLRHRNVNNVGITGRRQIRTLSERHECQNDGPRVTGLSVSAKSRNYATTTTTTNTPHDAASTFRSPFPDLSIEPETISHYIFRKANEYGDKVALIDDATGRTYTYSQIEELSRKVGSYLTRQGYRKGDVVCYFGTNMPEFCFLLLGCSTVGVILTTANPAYTTGELKRQMEHSGAKAVFTVPGCAQICKDAGIKDITVIGGEVEGCRPFSVVLDDDGRGFPSDVEIDPMNDVLVLPYSSGTTGLPKGVMLTHYSVVSNLKQFRESLISTSADTNLAVLPFYHIYGMMPILFGTLQDGGTLVTAQGFQPEAFLNTITNQKVTQIHIVPPIILFLARHPMVDKFDMKGLRTVLSAAAPLGETLTHEFMNKRDLPLKQGYGLTETSPVVAIDIDPPVTGSIGPVVCNTEAKFVDPSTGKPVGRNEAGELCVKGPQNMKGYYNNERATNEMITADGWLHTGDIGMALDDGRLVITDRLKELIKYKGLQIAPAELEDVIHTHPSVQDVAVIGVPDERAGEVPRAFVVCKPGSEVKEADIEKFVSGQVSEYKQLRGGVKIINEIPKNPSGKILRRVLKEG